MPTAILQEWEESERGWGERPDGYSLHLTRALRDDFIAKHWSDQPEETPEEYSRPIGDPVECEVNDDLIAELEKYADCCGVRFYGRRLVIEKSEHGFIAKRNR